MGEHSLQHTTDHVRNLQFGFCVSGCSNIPGAEIAQFFCLPAIRPTCTNQLIDTKIRTHLTFQIFLFTMKLLLKNNTFPTQTLPSCWSFNKYLEKLVFVQTEFLLNTPHFWPPPRWYPLPEASWSTSNRYLYPTRSRSSKKKKKSPCILLHSCLTRQILRWNSGNTAFILPRARTRGTNIFPFLTARDHLV